MARFTVVQHQGNWAITDANIDPAHPAYFRSRHNIKAAADATAAYMNANPTLQNLTKSTLDKIVTFLSGG